MAIKISYNKEKKLQMDFHTKQMNNYNHTKQMSKINNYNHIKQMNNYNHIKQMNNYNHIKQMNNNPLSIFNSIGISKTIIMEFTDTEGYISHSTFFLNDIWISFDLPDNYTSFKDIKNMFNSFVLDSTTIEYNFIRMYHDIYQKSYFVFDNKILIRIPLFNRTYCHPDERIKFVVDVYNVHNFKLYFLVDMDKPCDPFAHGYKQRKHREYIHKSIRSFNFDIDNNKVAESTINSNLSHMLLYVVDNQNNIKHDLIDEIIINCNGYQLLCEKGILCCTSNLKDYGYNIHDKHQYYLIPLGGRKKCLQHTGSYSFQRIDNAVLTIKFKHEFTGTVHFFTEVVNIFTQYGHGHESCPKFMY